MREFGEDQIVRVAVIDEIDRPLSDGLTHFTAAIVLAPSYGSKVRCRVLSTCTAAGTELLAHRTRVSPPGYRYQDGHSEFMVLGGVASLGWRSYMLGGRDENRRLVVSPKGDHGWFGALGALTFLASEGVIDLGRTNEPFDERDLATGLEEFKKFRQSGRLERLLNG